MIQIGSRWIGVEYTHNPEYVGEAKGWSGVRGECRQLGRVIWQKRKQGGLTLLESASLSGLSVSFLSQVENSKVEPSLPSLMSTRPSPPSHQVSTLLPPAP